MLELESPKYNEEEKCEMFNSRGDICGYCFAKESMSYIINPSQKDLLELVKHIDSYKDGDNKKKKMIENDIDKLYHSPNAYSEELKAQFSVNAIGNTDKILIYIGGEPVDSDYDTTELMNQHKKLWDMRYSFIHKPFPANI